MEEYKEKIDKNVLFSPKLISEHIRILDLSNIKFDDNVKLPINLIELNLSSSELSEVPISVLKLENLKVLNLSQNCIHHFDDKPNFCHTIQSLTIANNDLIGPPKWVCTETPSSLVELDLSGNLNITNALQNLEYYKELLKHKTLVTNIIIYNCKLREKVDLLSIFPKAKSCVLGKKNLLYSNNRNDLKEVPCIGIDNCCDIEYLNLCNTNIVNINPNIEIYKKMKEINLSYNKITCLPEEFCSLENLEICNLSHNSLYSLPENFCELRKLTSLSVDYNDLNALPSNICHLPNIKRLDAYDNYLYEVPDGLENLSEVDLAQNYFDEPNDDEYLEKKKYIRAVYAYRCDGRRNHEHLNDLCPLEESDQNQVRCCKSSSEEWDSEDTWTSKPSGKFVPHEYWSKYQSEFMASPSWRAYVERKVKEETTWPINAQTHIKIYYKNRRPRSITEQMTFKELYESDGQFDDYSDDGC